jgi:hypothetical protein
MILIFFFTGTVRQKAPQQIFHFYKKSKNITWFKGTKNKKKKITKE